MTKCERETDKKFEDNSIDSKEIGSGRVTALLDTKSKRMCTSENRDQMYVKALIHFKIHMSINIIGFCAGACASLSTTRKGRVVENNNMTQEV